MPQAKCRLGFSCAAMMMQPGLDATECLNRETCVLIVTYTADEQAELTRIRLEENQRVYEQIRVDRHQAAILMLQQRGNPQELEDFNLATLLASAHELLGAITGCLNENYAPTYIAPEGCEAHRYNVKRPGVEHYRDEQGQFRRRSVRKVFWYNKLTAKRFIFAPAWEEQNVRVLHLSHDDDPRNLEARRGIERRNRLIALRAKLAALVTELEDSLGNLRLPLEVASPLDANSNVLELENEL